MTLQDRAIFDRTVLGPMVCEEWLLTVETKSTGFVGFCVLVWWGLFFGVFFFNIWGAFILLQHKHSPNRAGRVYGGFDWLLSHELLCLVEQ